MTVVAVRKEKENIFMSCDSQVSWGSHKLNKSDSFKDNSKIFSVNGMLIGASGLLFESNLLKIFAKNHKPKDSEIDSVLEFIIEFRDWCSKKTGKSDYQLYNHIIIVLDKKIFSIIEYDVNEHKEFWSIGSGMFLALSALHLGHNTEVAVDVAKKYDMYCGGETLTLNYK